MTYKPHRTMNKLLSYISIFAGLAIMGSHNLYAQSETDAFSLSRSEIQGTARYLSMGGAFAAIGGDLSAAIDNPAAVAVFHASDFAVTGSLGFYKTQATWYNQYSRNNENPITTPQVGVAIVGYDPVIGKGFSFAINRSRKQHYNRKFTIATSPTGQLTGSEGLPFSLADYAAMTTPDNTPIVNLLIDNKGNYNSSAPWLSVLAHEAGWILPEHETGPTGVFQSGFMYLDKGQLVPFGPKRSAINMQESGYADNYDFSFGYNHSDRLYLGASIKYLSIYHKLRSYYDEEFKYADYLSLRNELVTRGGGVGLSLGGIVRPFEGLRLALAYHSPYWVSLTDTFYAEAESAYTAEVENKKYNLKGKTPRDHISYGLMTPSRIVLGAAYTFGQRGMISVSYDAEPFGSTRLEFEGSSTLVDNDAIKKHYGLRHTVRLGGELRLSPRFSLRAGGAYSSSPMNDNAGINNRTPFLVAGTLPHYIVENTQRLLSGGFGYRVSKRIFLDAAVMYLTNKSHAYAFPNLTKRNGELLPSDVFDAPAPITLTQNKLATSFTFRVSF